ncbi:MAG: hypothetical protein U0R72_16155 [Nakamurella multipartita]
MTERTARPPALSLGVLSLELPAGERWWAAPCRTAASCRSAIGRTTAIWR